jgi:hypothetical protein
MLKWVLQRTGCRSYCSPEELPSTTTLVSAASAMMVSPSIATRCCILNRLLAPLVPAEHAQQAQSYISRTIQRVCEHVATSPLAGRTADACRCWAEDDETSPDACRTAVHVDDLTFEA